MSQTDMEQTAAEAEEQETEKEQDQAPAAEEAKAPPPINVKQIQGILEMNKGARFRTWLNICARCGLCADSCFFYLAHDKDPKLSPAYKIKTTLGEMYKRKGVVDRDFLTQAKEVVWGQCSACRRCSMYCPFGIDMAAMFMTARAVCNSQGILPAGLARTKKNIIETGNQMAMAIWLPVSMMFFLVRARPAGRMPWELHTARAVMNMAAMSMPKGQYMEQRRQAEHWPQTTSLAWVKKSRSTTPLRLYISPRVVLIL